MSTTSRPGSQRRAGRRPRRAARPPRWHRFRWARCRVARFRRSAGPPGRRPRRSWCCPAPVPGSAGPTARACPARRPTTTAPRSAAPRDCPASGTARESAGRSRWRDRPCTPSISTVDRAGCRRRRSWTRGSRRRRTGGSCRTRRRRPRPVASSVLRTRPPAAGVNMPTTTVMSCSAAISRTALGPRAVQRLGDRRQGRRRTRTSSPPAAPPAARRRAAASAAAGRTRSRLRSGSIVLTICASAIRTRIPAPDSRPQRC